MSVLGSRLEWNRILREEVYQVRRSAAPILLSVAIAVTFAFQPATCSAAAVIIMQNYQKQQREDEARAKARAAETARVAAIEAAKPKQNILLDVSIKSANNVMSSQGPVASGSPLHLHLTEDREYISSKAYSADGELSGVTKFNAILGDEVVIVPSITPDGQILVEVSISHGTPKQGSESPWMNREFVTEKSNQTFLLGNGAAAVTRTVQIPGLENGLVINLKADIQAD